METHQYQRKTENRTTNKAGIAATRKLNKHCAVCGKSISIILRGKIIRHGGYYFGKIGMSSKREVNRVMKLGTVKKRLGNKFFNVLKEDPKPYKYVEYWECAKCFK